ncbi:MAG: hypothetical protein E6I50_06605 [Chloroflexi bacterium]|nr:MAG: hypothetical protein E6I50_06605 [Chloroflexota bacterium]
MVMMAHPLRLEHVEPAPAAPAPCRVGRVGHHLQLAQNRAQDDERHVEETRLGDVEDAAVDDDRGVEQHGRQPVGVSLVRPRAKEQRGDLGTPGQADRGALRRQQQREHEGKTIAIGQVAHEDADQNSDDKTNRHAEKSTQQVGQRSARQPEVDPPPSTEHVRRAQIGKDQSFQGRQPDDRPARVRVAVGPNHEITEQKTTDHSEPRPEESGQILGPRHGYLLKRPRTRPPLSIRRT